MINEARKILLEMELVPASAKIWFNIHYFRNHIVEAFDDVGGYFIIKMSPGLRIHEEFLATQRAFETLPGLAPEPFGYTETPGGGALVLKGYPHTNLTQRRLRRRRPQFVSALNDYISATKTEFATLEAKETNDAQLEMAISEIRELTRAEIPEVEAAAEILRHLPMVAQHGDMAANNIGLTEKGVIIFDWEDLGKSNLAGLDLCILIISALEFNTEAISRCIHAGAPYNLNCLIRKFCQIYGIEYQTYIDSIPIYLQIFHQLKLAGGYGEPVRRAISDVIRSKCWQSSL